ncbi:hypothetical protein [Robertmurraya andreesenii]|uniref:Uncharacterized protein n=1 Tax=Anoxybacillus andreesenii TaxID=1325932 RepID=A0ABT9UZR8_9BACL|nr:hypothetical protein [Robertmurraya andreesenii]MDQ0154186.1 hypothetical protein [Robertmurraya andreesenii]
MALEKMMYALRNMQVANSILSIKNSSFFKRVISRIILIRLPDFIRYARMVNNETKGNRSKADHAKVKEELNTLSNLYQEYLEDQRNKFGGHFKDEDYFERIQLWSEIQADKMIFFFDLAEEITDLLVPGQRKKYTLEEKDMAVFKEISEQHDLEKRPMMGTDILALSRYNTVSAINTHELHVKPAILNSLKIIIDYELNVLSRISQQDLRLIFKTLVLVDIISFADTLFTRNISTSSKQYMDGLDTVVERHSLQEAVAIFDKVKSDMKILVEVERFRGIRNIIGAHIDSNSSMKTLLTQFDALNPNDLYFLFQDMLQLFQRVCRTDQTLKISQLGPTPIPDAIETTGQPEKAYDSSSIPAKSFTPLPYTYEAMSDIWDTLLLEGKDDGNALDYFGRAFYSSEAISSWQREIPIGLHATRYEYPEYRIVHQFIENKLRENQHDLLTIRVLHRIIKSNNIGTSHILSTLLYQMSTDISNREGKLLLLDMFGEISDVYEMDIIELLKKNTNSNDPLVARVAFYSLALIDAKHNGIRRINGLGRHSGDEVDFSSFLLQQLDKLTVQNKILVSLTLLSSMYLEQGFVIYYEKYTKATYFPQLINCLQRYIPRLLRQTNVDEEKVKDILKCIDLHNYGKVAILIGDELSIKDEKKAKHFYEAVANGAIRIDWNQNVLIMNRAIALSRLEYHDDAIKTVEFLVRQNPEEKIYRFLALEIAAIGKMDQYFNEASRQLENKFLLNKDDIEAIDELRKLL